MESLNRRQKDNRRRRARKRQRDKLLAQQGNRCAECSLPMLLDSPFDRPDSVTIDHVIPMSAGGSNKRENMELVHTRCNYARNRRHMLARQARRSP